MSGKRSLLICMKQSVSPPDSPPPAVGDAPGDSLADATGDDVCEDRVQVTCGYLTGDLIRRLFICPGLHQSCIEMADGDLITPKRFSVMGQKERLKDWKNAIRIGGVSFRKLMDTGELEFFAHDAQCTGRCVSRNSGSSKYDAKIEQLNRSMLSATTFDNDLPTFAPALANTLNEHAYTVLRHAQGLSPPPPATSPAHSAADSPASSMSVIARLLDASDVVVKEEPRSDNEADDDAAAAPGYHDDAYMDHGGDDTSRLRMLCRAATEFPTGDSILEDSDNFWRGIVSMGLLEDFVREMKHALDTLKNDVLRNADSNDSEKLSRVAMELGLTTKLQWKLSEHTNAIRKQDEKLMLEIATLKKKVAESEKKRKELKRKTDCFAQLMDSYSQKRSRSDMPNSTTQTADDSNS